MIVQIFLGLTFPAVGSRYEWTFIISLCIIFLCEGAHFTLVPIMITKLFGDQATMVYSIGFSFSGFSSLISSVLVTFVL